ncbi:MAG: DUF2934 domain-containing protein [Acidobacteria bacterium]|nr:DUF2934 domain-containing protein [Acidobacteriota bacterium]MBW4044535.1 DUF2934 domain-containing protein [Acidobacteriota bacterium]
MPTADATKTATKRRKPAAEGTAKPAAKAKTTAKATTPGPVAVPRPTHEEISRLAEQFWNENGRPHGSAEHDWLRAEQHLLGKAS